MVANGDVDTDYRPQARADLAERSLAILTPVIQENHASEQQLTGGQLLAICETVHSSVTPTCTVETLEMSHLANENQQPHPGALVEDLPIKCVGRRCDAFVETPRAPTQVFLLGLVELSN
jgi:hypothetical protein